MLSRILGRLNRWLEGKNERLEDRQRQLLHEMRCGDDECTDDHPRGRFSTRG